MENAMFYCGLLFLIFFAIKFVVGWTDQCVQVTVPQIQVKPWNKQSIF